MYINVWAEIGFLVPPPPFTPLTSSHFRAVWNRVNLECLKSQTMLGIKWHNHSWQNWLLVSKLFPSCMLIYWLFFKICCLLWVLGPLYLHPQTILKSRIVIQVSFVQAYCSHDSLWDLTIQPFDLYCSGLFLYNY